MERGIAMSTTIPRPRGSRSISRNRSKGVAIIGPKKSNQGVYTIGVYTI